METKIQGEEKEVERERNKVIKVKLFIYILQLEGLFYMLV